MDFRELYNQWKSNGVLQEKDVQEILKDSNIEPLSEFLVETINGSKDIGQVSEIISFTNYLLSRRGSLIGALQNVINAVINKLMILAKKVGAVFFNVDVGINIHLSVTFQVHPIEPRLATFSTSSPSP